MSEPKFKRGDKVRHVDESVNPYEMTVVDYTPVERVKQNQTVYYYVVRFADNVRPYEGYMVEDKLVAA